jgi:23S rRNA (adenine2503-C2)-methyltransferase
VASKLAAPRFRADQIFEWIHRHRVQDVDEMANIPKALRLLITEHGDLRRLERHGDFVARDGTRKLRLRTLDGYFIESVLIPNDQRGFTLCVSSQVGCSMTCRFCATASLPFERNLAAWEIVDQVEQAQDLLEQAWQIDEPQAQAAGDEERGAEPLPYRLSNVVYMGMGEPLHNFVPVKSSVDIVTDPKGAAITSRRITISTSGLVPAIERFSKDPLSERVGLAVSLNATTDEVRDEVMPINLKWPISDLLDAVRALPDTRRRDLTFEYVLLEEVNDFEDDAHRLADLVREFDCHINVIPFNPHAHAPYRRPSSARVHHFMTVAKRRGLRVYLRTPRGDDIGAACGQLALEGERGRVERNDNVEKIKT